MNNNLNYEEVEAQNVENIPDEPKKDFGLVSMICGILSTVLGCGLNIPLGIVAIVFALKDKKQYGAFKSFAIPGLITGIVGTSLGAMQLVIVGIYVLIYVFIIIFNIALRLM